MSTIGRFFKAMTGGEMAQQSGIAPHPDAPANAPGAGGGWVTPSEAGGAVGMAGGALAGVTADLGGQLGHGFAAGLGEFVNGLFKPGAPGQVPPGRVAVVWIVIIAMFLIGLSSLLRPGTGVAILTKK